jgi:hypothetical protein
MPSDYLRLFRALDVPYLDPATGERRSAVADVHVYCNQALERRRQNQHEKAELTAFLRRELSRPSAERTFDVRDEHRLAVARAFFSNGTPQQIAVALSLALSLGRCTPSSLQRYCDDLSVAGMGVDCNGFVGRFLEARGVIREMHSIGGFRRESRRRSRLPGPDAAGVTGMDRRAVRALDVLVWQPGADSGVEHVAIIDAAQGSRLVVCESSGTKGGLAMSEYTVLNAARDGTVPDGVFRVDRGNGDGVSEVEIFAPG